MRLDELQWIGIFGNYALDFPEVARRFNDAGFTKNPRTLLRQGIADGLIRSRRSLRHENIGHGRITLYELNI